MRYLYYPYELKLRKIYILKLTKHLYSGFTHWKKSEEANIQIYSSGEFERQTLSLLLKKSSSCTLDLSHTEKWKYYLIFFYFLWNQHAKHTCSSIETAFYVQVKLINLWNLQEPILKKQQGQTEKQECSCKSENGGHAPRFLQLFF